MASSDATTISPIATVAGERTRVAEQTTASEEESLTSALSERALELPRPETVLREAEAEQARRMAIAGVWFNASGLVVAPLFGGSAHAQILFLVALAFALLLNAWLGYVTLRGRYQSRHSLIYFALAPFSNAAILYHLGVFGPILVVLVLNVYTTCLGYRRRVAHVTFVGAVLPVAVLGGGIALGVLDDVGLISVVRELSGVARGAIVLGLILFLGLVYGQARSTRRIIVASLVERDEAVRTASHREAMFLEARQDLERALHAGGMGRFTDQVLGAYKLGAVIGRGGMGEVYEAVDVASGEVAAVKMILPEVLSRPAYVRRFMREVRIASSLESPHVAKVLAVGDESAPLPYLAMELLKGEDLAQRLRRVDKLPLAEVVTLVEHACRAVDAAATAGIVHRDLKPQNLFAVDGGTTVWKVLDFGVSKIAAGATLTRGEAIGTPQYMAPEQATGAEVDVRSDLYAVAAIAYRALIGIPPFSGGDASEVMIAVTKKMPIRPSVIVAIPDALELVLAVALAKDPDERLQNPTELAKAFAAGADGVISPSLGSRAKRLLETNPWSDVR